MVSERKVEIVESLTEDFTENRNLVVTDFQGLTVEETEELRQGLYEEGSRFRVVKNRLAIRAFRQAFSGSNGSQKVETDESTQDASSDDSADERELGDISGLGPSKVEALKEEGFESVSDIAGADIDELTAVSGIGESTAEKFQDEAEDLVPKSDGQDENPKPSPSKDVIQDDLVDRIDELLEGNTAIALSGDGYVNVAEVLVEFAEEHESLQIKGGVLNGGFLEPDEVESVSELPSRRELLTMLAGTLKKPLQDLVHHLQYPLQQLVRTLNEIKDDKEEE